MRAGLSGGPACAGDDRGLSRAGFEHRLGERTGRRDPRVTPGGIILMDDYGWHPGQGARLAIDEFFAEWLRFDRALGSVKDRRRYPEFTPELAAMMVQETRLLLGHLVWSDGNFMDAFTADYSFLNSDLASVYGLPGPLRLHLRAAIGHWFRNPDGSAVRICELPIPLLRSRAALRGQARRTAPLEISRKPVLLTRFQKAMGPELYDRFVERYRERVLAELGHREPFFYPFKRILFWGRCAA